jgi:hypothetical protein
MQFPLIQIMIGMFAGLALIVLLLMFYWNRK